MGANGADTEWCHKSVGHSAQRIKTDFFIANIKSYRNLAEYSEYFKK